VTVTVLAGAVCVTVGDGCVVVTVTVLGRVTVSGCAGGACDVSVGVVVVGVVRVAVERVAVVGAVRVDVLVPTATLLPPPPHDESAKAPNAIRIAAVASLTGRALCHSLLAARYMLAMISRCVATAWVNPVIVVYLAILVRRRVVRARATRA
jgi:hypothetical protein